MKTVSIKANIVYNFIYQLTVMILPLITAPYISRIIGAEGIGVFSYYHSISLYFVYFAMLGVSNYGNRNIAKVSDSSENKNKTFSSIYALQICTSMIVLLLYIIYVNLFVYDNKIVAFILVFHVISAFFDVSWLFFGLQEFKITAIRQIIIRVLTFLAIFIFVRKTEDLWIYTLIMSLSYLISSIILWGMMFSRVKWVKPSKNDIIKNIKPTLLLFVPIIATSVYRALDKIMIGKMCNMVEVGYYESAEKLIYISLGLISAFGSVMMPKISSLVGKKQYTECKRLFKNSMEFALCIGMAIGFGIAAVSNEFIPIFFGSGFYNSIPLSIALSGTIPVITWAAIIRMLFLIPNEKDSIYVSSVVVGAVLDLVFNLIFIPIFGTFGAVIGTWVAEISVALYQTIKLRKELNFAVYFRKAIIYAIIGIIMLFVVRCFANIVATNILNLIIEISIGSIVYIILSILYLIVSKNEVFFNYVNKLKKKGFYYEK